MFYLRADVSRARGQGRAADPGQYSSSHAEQQKKGEPREKRPRVERKNDYEFNPDIIDENTVIPPLPKKAELIAKPDIKLIKEREGRNNAKIEEIIEKKVRLCDRLESSPGREVQVQPSGGRRGRRQALHLPKRDRRGPAAARKVGRAES